MDLTAARKMARYICIAIGIGVVVTLVYGSIFLPPPPQVFDNSDKWLHVVVYAAIGLWFACLYPRHILWVLLGGTVLGLGLEFLQGLTHTRQANVWDAAANTIGCAMGITTLRALLFLTGRQPTSA